MVLLQLVTLGAAMALGNPCGVTRWPAKTLSYPGASSLSTTSVATTVDALRAKTAPADPDRLADRLAPVETTLWSVHARLLAYRVERDSDYHLVIADLVSGKTMLAEIPSPDCVQSHQDVYARERTYVETLGGHRASTHYRWLQDEGIAPPVVTVAGYGFFDHVKKHGGDDPGQAPNGIELHPILAISAERTNP
jgi:hypothetical protein